jgi:hypothetical protein
VAKGTIQCRVEPVTSGCKKGASSAKAIIPTGLQEPGDIIAFADTYGHRWSYIKLDPCEIGPRENGSRVLTRGGSGVQSRAV